MYDTVSYYSDTATDQRKIRWLEDIELKHCVKHEIDEIELKHCASSKTSVKSSRKYFVHLNWIRLATNPR
jgi:hypothetical protein